MADTSHSSTRLNPSDEVPPWHPYDGCMACRKTHAILNPRATPQRTEVCRNGHPKTGDNLLVMGDGVQRCRICTRESWRVSSVPKNARRKAERAARRAS